MASMNFYVTSFVSILHFISDDLIQCDASTRIAELFCDEFDDLDFELAICCFEATTSRRLRGPALAVRAGGLRGNDDRGFHRGFVEDQEQRDPLFVTKRFLMFQESLTKAFTEESQGPEEEEEN